ncbi:MAG: S1C family serine protease [Verrucomicrobiota bacterium]
MQKAFRLSAGILLTACLSPLAHADSKKSDEAKKIVEEQFSSIAIIEGDIGNGTGFIINEGEVTRLYTAAHVLCGNKRLTVKNADGRKFTKFGTFEVAEKSDLARIELKEDFESGIERAEPGSAKVKTKLLAIGNSGGAGVLTVLNGEAKSLGPDSIEVTNGVIQGNSGGPVFSGESGKLLGVVTHATAGRDDIWAKDTDFDEVRRFATRLDRKIKWQQMPIGRFLKEDARLEDFNRNTRILYAISVLDPTKAGLRLDTRVGDGGPTILSIFEENEEVPIVAALFDMNTELASKRMRTSDNGLISRFGKFYRSALHELNRDAKEFNPKGFSGYNREAAKQSVKWRKDAVKDLESAAARLKG